MKLNTSNEQKIKLGMYDMRTKIKDTKKISVLFKVGSLLGKQVWIEISSFVDYK